MKHFVYRFSPEVLHTFYQRIEASPLGYRLAKGAFWSLAGAVISRGLGLLSAILVGRMLGKEDYGELGIIQNTIGMFGTVAGFGMGLTANKHVAEFKNTDPARAGRILGLASATAWISSGVMAMALLASATWLATHTLAAPHLAPLLQIGALLLLLSGVNGAQQGALSGFEAFKEIARINLIAGVLTFPLMVIGAWHWGVAGAVWGLIGSQLINCLLSFLAIRVEAAKFHIHYAHHGCLAEAKMFWEFSLPSVLVGLLNSVVGWGASALVVNQVGGYGDMGIYNAVMRIKSIPDAVLGMIVAPIIPILSETFRKSGQADYGKTLRAYLVMSVLVTVPVSLLLTAAPALTVMPFGAQYQGRPFIVIWMMLFSVLTALGNCSGYLLVTAGRAWVLWVFGLLFAVSYGAGALLLVPRYGAVGCAASMALGYVVQFVVSMVFLYRKYPVIMRFTDWGKLASGSLLLYGACFAAGALLPFGPAVGLGGIAAVVYVMQVLRFWRSRPVATS